MMSLTAGLWRAVFRRLHCDKSATIACTDRLIGVASYRIVRRLPKELMGQLPDPRQIEQILMRMGE